jgi:hypothetical protein
VKPSEKNRESLADCFARYGSDKTANGYTPTYERIFGPIRDDAIELLEIGIGTMRPNVPSSMVYVYGENASYRPGASLRAWRDYFKNSWITGGDVQDDCLFSEHRIETRLFDSTDKTACDAALGPQRFDIIIDDGLHTADANICTFRNLWPRVEPGGWYIIEDVHPPLFNIWTSVFASVEAEKSELNNGQWTFLMFRKPFTS